MNKKKKKNKHIGNEDEEGLNLFSSQENSHVEFTKINYEKTEEENNVLKEIETIKNENRQLIEILEEKEKLIKQLMNENKTLQENYDLIVSNIVEKDTIMEALEKISNKIDEVNKGQQKPLYSHVVENKKVDISNSQKNNIIIKSSKKEYEHLTRKYIEENIDPVRSKIKINNITNLAHGIIRIQCNSENDSNKLREEISSKLKGKVCVEQKILSYPKIKIPGIKLESSISSNDLKQLIIDQNEIIQEKDLFEIDYIKYVAFKKTHTIFARVSGNLYRKLISPDSKLFIGWQSCRIFDYNDLRQCSKCQKFNHSEKNCRNEIVCPFCSGKHSFEQCNKDEKDRKCVNCTLANEKYRKKYKISHSSNDHKNCESAKYFEFVNKSKIDFNG